MSYFQQFANKVFFGSEDRYQKCILFNTDHRNVTGAASPETGNILKKSESRRTPVARK